MNGLGRIPIVAAVWVMVAACISTFGVEDAALPLKSVRFWAYQIQGLEEPGAVDALARSRYDLLVIEPTRTDASSPESKNFPMRQVVQKLKAGKASDGVHRKLVLAYIDIGEAEGWRWYWTWSRTWKKGSPRPADWPDFILGADPGGWSDNWVVAFWDPKWKDILLYGKNTPRDAGRDYASVLDEVVKDGFDGVYLDWVEAWEEKRVAAAARKAGLDPAAEMIKLIGEIRACGKRAKPDFLVFQQNSPGLIEGHPELAKVIDALGQEDIWWDGDPDVKWDDPAGYDRAVAKSDSKETVRRLKLFQDAGLPVFDVEYAVKHAGEAYETANRYGYITYCSRTPLSRLTTTLPPGLPKNQALRAREYLPSRLPLCR